MIHPPQDKPHSAGAPRPTVEPAQIAQVPHPARDTVPAAVTENFPHPTEHTTGSPVDLSPWNTEIGDMGKLRGITASIKDMRFSDSASKILGGLQIDHNDQNKESAFKRDAKIAQYSGPGGVPKEAAAPGLPGAGTKLGFDGTQLPQSGFQLRNTGPDPNFQGKELARV